MLTQIALAMGLCAVAAEPTATITLHPVPGAFPYTPQQSQSESLFESPQDCTTCGSRHGIGPYSWRCHFLFSPCNMPQHMPYWNKERGYYYFRPYHVAHVAMQQEKALSWNLDRHNPYDNRFLDRIHDEWAADEAIKEKQRNIESLPGTEGEMMMPEEAAEEVPGNDPPPEKPAEKAEEKPAEKAEEKTPQEGAAKPARLKKLFTFGFSKP